MGVAGTDDAELRARFDDAVATHGVALMRYCRFLSNDRVSADDLLQDTLLQAFRGFGDFRGDASVKTWLFTVARHRAHRLGRRKAGEPAAHEDLMTLGLEAGWGQPEAAVDPEAAVEASERRTRIERALASLTESDREIITLRELEEFSTAEVAEALGITETAARARLHRARLRFVASLRREMDRHG